MAMEKPVTVRVLVVQPDPLCREGLCRVLEEGAGVKVLGATGTGDEAIAMARTLRPDVVLMELDLPDMAGLALLEEIARLPAKPLVLSRQTGRAFITAAFARGAKGYVPRTAEPREVLEAIRMLHQGREYLHPALAPSLLPSRPGEVTDLTDRDWSFLVLLARGATNGEIASTLYLSEKTVRNSLSLLFNKLGVRNRLEAVAVARERGYV